MSILSKLKLLTVMGGVVASVSLHGATLQLGSDQKVPKGMEVSLPVTLDLTVAEDPAAIGNINITVDYDEALFDLKNNDAGLIGSQTETGFRDFGVNSALLKQVIADPVGGTVQFLAVNTSDWSFKSGDIIGYVVLTAKNKLADSTVKFSDSAELRVSSSTTNYIIRNVSGVSDVGTVQDVSVKVIDLFTANDDTATTPEEAVKVVDVLANDQHFNTSGTELTGGDKYSVAVTKIGTTTVSGQTPIDVKDDKDVKVGSVVVNVDGTLSVTPVLNYNGPITFDYTATASPSSGDVTSTASVTVTVTPVNDRPTLTSVTNQTGSKAINEDSPLKITLAMLNDEADVDGDALTVVLTDGSNYSVSGDTVTPDKDYNGTITVPVAVKDSTLTSTPPVNMTIEVKPVNDAPVLTSVTDQATDEETPLTVTLAMLNDEADVDGDALTVVLTDGANYSVSGAVVTPNKDYNGVITVPVAVSDGKLTSSPTVDMKITVRPVNDAPVLTAVTDQATDEDAPLTITLGMLDDEADVDGDALTVVLTDGANYSVSGAKVTPDKDFHGTITVPVAVSDGTLTSKPAVNMTVTVKPVNDVPEFSTKTITPSKDLLTPADITVNVAAFNTNESETYTYKYVWKSGDKVIKTVDFGSASSAVLTAADQAGASLSGNYPVSCVVTAKDNGQSGSPLADDFKEGTVTLQTYVGNMPPQFVSAGTTDDSVTIKLTEGEGSTIDVEARDNNGSVANSPQDDGIKTINFVFQKSVSAGAKYEDAVDASGWAVLSSQNTTNPPLSASAPANSDTLVDAVKSSFDFTTDNNTQLHDDSLMHRVFVTVTDGNGVTATRFWKVEVTDDNSDPVLNGTTIVIAPSTPKTDNDLKATVTPLATDADKEDQDGAADPKVDKLKYVVKWYDKADMNTVIHTDTLPLSDAYVSTLDSSNTDKNKTYVAEVRVKDSVDAFAVDSTSASVTVINTAPALKSPAVDIDQAANEDAAATYVAATLTGAFSDADSDNLSVSMVEVKSGSKGKVSINGGGDVVFDPNNAFESLDDSETATSVIKLTITDGDVDNEGKAATEFTVTVNGANDAPVVNSGDVKLVAKNSSDEVVSASKPDQIVKFTVSIKASDVDTNDAKLDTKVVKFELARKGVSSPYTFTATNVNFDKANTVEIDVTPADLGLSGADAVFKKDDKLQVTVVVTDGTADSAAIPPKKVTIGNPPWFPVVELATALNSGGRASALEDGTYRVVYTLDSDSSEVAVLEVGISAAKTEILPIDYINGDWKGEVAGLLDNTDYRISSVKKYNSLSKRYDIDLNVVAGGLLVSVDSYDDATADTGILTAVQSGGKNTNSYEFSVNLTDVSGYIYSLTSDNGVSKTKTVFFMPDSDGAISTADSVMVTEKLENAGSYTFTIQAINPVTLDADAGNVVTKQLDYDGSGTDPEVDGQRPEGSDSVDWSKMIPGGGLDYYKGDEPQSVGNTDAGGSKEVSFSWPAVKWATNYLVYVATTDGQDIPGLGRVPSVDTTVNITLKPGIYQWYVIARNDNGYSERWSDVAWFKVETTGGATLPSVSSAKATIDPATDDIEITGVANSAFIRVYIYKDNVPFAYVDKVTAESAGTFSAKVGKDVVNSGTYTVYVNAFADDNVSTGWKLVTTSLSGSSVD